MEEKQKKTTKAVKQTEAKKLDKTSNKTTEKKPTKTAATKKATDDVKTASKKATTKSAKEVTKKETVKAIKEEPKKKAAKLVKDVADAEILKVDKEKKEKETKTKAASTAKAKTAKAVEKENEKISTPKTTKKTVKTTAQKVDKKPTKIEKEEQEKKPTGVAKTKANRKVEVESKVISDPKEKINKTEESTKDKKHVDISIGLILCVIIILGLIILNVKLGKHAYDIITKTETTTTDSEVDDASTTQEIGNVLKSDSEVAKKLVEKITFSPVVTASIFNVEAFDEATISNDLKLKIAWSKINDDKRLKSINENNELIESIEKATMDESIKEIFGPEAEIKSESFDYTNVSTFSASSDKVTYNGGIYTTREQQTEEIIPVVYQEVEKVVRYSDRIVVYVKVAYMDVEDGKYIAYKKFSNGNLTEKLFEITPGELFGDTSFDSSTGEGAISLATNKALDSIRTKLDTYKYTFEIDKTTQSYYLSEFGK